MLLKSAILSGELVQANTVLEAQVPLLTGSNKSGEGKSMGFLHLPYQKSSLDPLVVLCNGVKIKHCFPKSQLFLEGGN